MCVSFRWVRFPGLVSPTKNTLLFLKNICRRESCFDNMLVSLRWGGSIRVLRFFHRLFIEDRAVLTEYCSSFLGGVGAISGACESYQEHVVGFEE